MTIREAPRRRGRRGARALARRRLAAERHRLGRARPRAIVASDHAWLLVAEADGRIAGTLIAAWDGWRGNFYRLAVLPELRRRGIAAALVRAGEERLRAAGARRLAAIVRRRPTAAGFWTAAGYEHQAEAAPLRQERRARAQPGSPTAPARRFHAVRAVHGGHLRLHQRRGQHERDDARSAAPDEERGVVAGGQVAEVVRRRPCATRRGSRGWRGRARRPSSASC